MKIAEDIYKIFGNGNIYFHLIPVHMVIDLGEENQKGFVIFEIEKIISLINIKELLLTHLNYYNSGNDDIFSNGERYFILR